MREEDITAAERAGGNVAGAAELLISEDAYRRAIEDGRAAVAPYLGTLLRDEGDVDDAEASHDRATTEGAIHVSRIANEALLRRRRLVLPQLDSEGEAGDRDEIKPAAPKPAATGDAAETIGRGDSEIDGGRGNARSGASLLPRPKLLLGGGLIIAVAIAGVSEVTQSNARHPRATAPNVKAAAARRAPRPKRTPTLNAAPTTTTTTVAASPPSRTSPIRRTAGTSGAATTSSTASGNLGGTTSANGRATAMYGGVGVGRPTSSSHTSTGTPPPVTGSPQPVTGSPQPVTRNPQPVTGNPQPVTGNPHTGSSEPTRRTGAPGHGNGSSGKNSSPPAATSTGPAPSGGTRTGVISSGGG